MKLHGLATVRIVLPRTEIDGRLPCVEDLLTPALVNFSQITVMRGRAVRGLGLHLARLDTANQEPYGVDADLPSCEAVFLADSSGVASVGGVDDQDIPGNPEITKRLTSLYASIP